IEGNWHRGANVDIALERLESLRLDRDVVRIRRQIAEHVFAGRIRRGRPAETGDAVDDSDLDRLHHAAGRILDGPLDGARAAQTLGASTGYPDRGCRGRDLERNREQMEPPPR